MPGDVQKNDLVTGSYDEKLQNDMRSFESVAKEDGKQLLCVYAYMKEFDDIGEYFLDHFQKAIMSPHAAHLHLKRTTGDG